MTIAAGLVYHFIWYSAVQYSIVTNATVYKRRIRPTRCKTKMLQSDKLTSVNQSMFVLAVMSFFSVCQSNIASGRYSVVDGVAWV